MGEQLKGLTDGITKLIKAAIDTTLPLNEMSDLEKRRVDIEYRESEHREIQIIDPRSRLAPRFSDVRLGLGEEGVAGLTLTRTLSFTDRKTGVTISFEYYIEHSYKNLPRRVFGDLTGAETHPMHSELEKLSIEELVGLQPALVIEQPRYFGANYYRKWNLNDRPDWADGKQCNLAGYTFDKNRMSPPNQPVRIRLKGPGGSKEVVVSPTSQEYKRAADGDWFDWLEGFDGVPKRYLTDKGVLKEKKLRAEYEGWSMLRATGITEILADLSILEARHRLAKANFCGDDNRLPYVGAANHSKPGILRGSTEY